MEKFCEENNYENLAKRCQNIGFNKIPTEEEYNKVNSFCKRFDGLKKFIVEYEDICGLLIKGLDRPSLTYFIKLVLEYRNKADYEFKTTYARDRILFFQIDEVFTNFVSNNLCLTYSLPTENRAKYYRTLLDISGLLPKGSAMVGFVLKDKESDDGKFEFLVSIDCVELSEEQITMIENMFSSIEGAKKDGRDMHTLIDTTYQRFGDMFVIPNFSDCVLNSLYYEFIETVFLRNDIGNLQLFKLYDLDEFEF